MICPGEIFPTQPGFEHGTSRIQGKNSTVRPWHDEVAEWLRRWTANPLGSPRVSSNLILVDVDFYIVFDQNNTGHEESKLNESFENSASYYEGI